MPATDAAAAGPTPEITWRPHSAHWGAFQAAWDGARLHVRPHAADPDPNPIIDNLPDAVRHPVRVAQPMVRRGWLERGPGPDARRGDDDFVPMAWPEVLDLLAAELRRVKDAHGAQSVFGGSYGWSSAGRFHHAQSQLHRFLNVALGGYVRSVNSYSAGASAVILPHILGSFEDVARRGVSWEQVVEHTQLVLAFGGMAAKNARVASGGLSRHIERPSMAAAAARGCRFVCLSPLRDDLPPEACGEWVPVRPTGDTALMLALVHTLVTRGMHDQAFLERCCDGWDRFLPHLLGQSDGQPKSAAWAAPICGVDAARIEALALALPGRRVLVTVSHSLQRAEHGEQPVWMGMVLAAALGQLGLPGGGFAYALGALGHYGRRQNAVPVAALPQGHNAVQDFIPVARIADLLLHPGEPFRYDGATHHYAHIRLAYWAGGNPFHHHQDLARLHRAFARLDTLVVHEIAWTATARHADIVLPATMTLEREDIGGAPTDPLLVAMHRVLPPYAQARDDFEIFRELSARLGCETAFTEGRSVRQWLEALYEKTRAALAARGDAAPDFATFWAQGELQLPQLPDDGGLVRAFRDDPQARPLPTESGRAQIHSPRIAAFGDASCPGHPAWLPPAHAPDTRHPLWLVANQPAAKLHSQLDYGALSRQGKRQGRERCRVHPADAAARGIADGDLVRLFNDRGEAIACAALDSGVAVGVVQLPTGAWFDPPRAADGALDFSRCVHGNPNVLTHDVGTSALAQGCCGQLSAVQLARLHGPAPPTHAFDPPTCVDPR